MTYKLDHIAIQTNDYENTVGWYKAYFECEETWGRRWDQLPAGIQERMPTKNLVELKVDEIRFHIFDMQQDYIDIPEQALQYQHFAITVDTMDDLHAMREKWIMLYKSGNYRYRKTSQPTEIIPSPGNMNCFYAYDPNGLEFEIIHFG